MTTLPSPVPTAAALPVVILGAGPAGLSTALWLERLGLRFLLVDRGTALGGSLPRINLAVTEYLGRHAANGADLLDTFQRHFHACCPDAEPRLQTEVHSVHLDPLRIETAHGPIAAAALVVALGCRRRRLGLPGERELQGKGLSYSATSDLERIAGAPVAVVGGGDGALENALILAERCPKVFLLHRRAELRARAEFRERVLAHPRIEILAPARVLALESDAQGLAALRLQTLQGERRLALRWLVVKAGFEPNSEPLPSPELRRDAEGYLEVDRYLHTSAPGVFAAGDICNPRSPCVAASVGDGAVAAREVLAFLRGSAPRRMGS